MTHTSLITLRRLLFGITGLLCLLYATLALLWATATPMPFWIPGAAGVASGLLLFLTSAAAGKKPAEMAWDEGYSADTSSAAKRAFWIGIALFPLFGLALSAGLTSTPVAYAATGLLMAASYLLSVVWSDLRGEV